MSNVMFSIPMFIAVITASAFFAVAGMHRKRPDDRIYKFIPSIVCFVISVNLIYILFYGWDMVSTDLLVILLVVFLAFVSIIGFLSTLIFAGILEVRQRRLKDREGENENEKA
jgi:amino acid transporter